MSSFNYRLTTILAVGPAGILPVGSNNFSVKSQTPSDESANLPFAKLNTRKVETLSPQFRTTELEKPEQKATKITKDSAGHITLVPLLRHAAVNFNPIVDAQNPVVIQLRVTLHTNHQTRNQLQHVNPALSVDDQHCADAILDAVDTIEHCFSGSWAGLQFALRIALRVVGLHSSQGDLPQRNEFEDAMRTTPLEWR